MATLAQQLVGISSEAAATEGQGMGKGLVALGNRIAQVNDKKAALAQQQAAMEQRKIERFSDAVVSGSKLKDASARGSYFKNFLPQLRSGLGLDETFSDQSLQMIGSSPDLQDKFVVLRSKVQRGEMSVEEAMSTVNDPEKLAGLSDDKLLKAEQFAISQETQGLQFAAKREERAETRVIQEERLETKATAKLGRDQEKDVQKFSQFFTKNDIPGAVNTLKKIDKLIDGGLDNPKGDIPGVGQTGNLPNAVLSAKGKELRQVAGELRNSLLKLRSGGAVTPDEAKRLLEELGMSQGIVPQFKTDKEFIDGIRRVRDKIRDTIASHEAGFSSDVVGAFSDRLSTGSLRSNDEFFAGKKNKARPVQLGKVTRAAFDAFDDAKKKLFLKRSNVSSMKELTKLLDEKGK